MTGKEHLQWATDRALEYYDMGDETGALASFLSDVGKHDSTRHIQGFPASMMILRVGMGRGRAEFKKAMLDFAVHD